MRTKWFHKLFIAGTLLVTGITSTIEPIHSFADVNQDKTKMFAKSMNEYSDLLITGLNFDFDLLAKNDAIIKLQKDHSVAKKNAEYWEHELKKMLINTNQATIDYDKEFQTGYQNIISAVEKNDKSLVKENLTVLQTSIQQKQKMVQKLTDELKKFRELIGIDLRGLTNDIKDFTTSLGALNEKEAEKKLLDVIDAMAGMSFMGIPYYKKSDLDKMRTEIRQLFAFIFSVKESFPKALESMNNAIDSISVMTAKWDEMESKFNGLQEQINDASTVNLNFMKPELEAAKATWNDMKAAAEELNKELKNLK